MRKLKAFLSAVLITTATFAATACSSKDSSSSTDIIMDEEKRTKLFEIAENEDLLKGEIENKKIKWLSNWDINPDVNSGKYTPPDLALFKEIYGGEIEYIACTKSDLLYDKLAKSISSGEGVDFFYGGNLDALYDLLSESAEEIGVITVNTDELKMKTGKRYNAFIRLLKDVERENESFYFCPDPFGTDKI